jgi:hypothetical protein
MNNKKLCLSTILFVLFSVIRMYADTRKELKELTGPILANECLAYKMVDKIEGGPHNVLQLYAQNINNPDKLRLLGEWSPVSEGNLQFTNNKRDCFFMIQRPIPNSFQGSLYKFSGDTGEVKYILDVAQLFRISRDGKFLVFSLLSLYDIYHNVSLWQARIIIAVWSIESNDLLKIFDWKVKENDVCGVGFEFAGDINDNIINVYYIVEGGGVFAQAAINLETHEFEILWDITDVKGFSDKLKTIDDIFQYDDVVNKYKDRDLRLSPQ